MVLLWCSDFVTIVWKRRFCFVVSIWCEPDIMSILRSAFFCQDFVTRLKWEEWVLKIMAQLAILKFYFMTIERIQFYLFVEELFWTKYLWKACPFYLMDWLQGAWNLRLMNGKVLSNHRAVRLNRRHHRELFAREQNVATPTDVCVSIACATRCWKTELLTTKPCWQNFSNQ